MASGTITKPTKITALPTRTADQTIALPPSFSVLFITVGAYAVNYDISIPITHLGNTAKSFRQGQYVSSSDWSRFTVEVSTTYAKVIDFDINGTSYKSTADFTVSYLP